MTPTNCTPYSIARNRYTLAISLSVALLLLTCATVHQVQAAEPAQDKAQAHAAHATHANNFTLAQSTPVDKLIVKLYPNSPLNMSVLRKALFEANPKVLTGNPQQRVKAGTVVVVPDHGQLVHSVLSPLAIAPKEAVEASPPASDIQTRKQWVRFP